MLRSASGHSPTHPALARAIATLYVLTVKERSLIRTGSHSLRRFGRSPRAGSSPGDYCVWSVPASGYTPCRPNTLTPLLRGFSVSVMVQARPTSGANLPDADVTWPENWE